jgi:hypothetical protein
MISDCLKYRRASGPTVRICGRASIFGEFTFVNQDQTEVIPGRELLVDISEGWSEIEAA